MPRSRSENPKSMPLKRFQKQKEELGKEVSEFGKIETGEPSKVEILRELAQVLPDTVWIWNLKYTGKEVEISGFADSASDLIPLLDRSPFFEKVEFLAPVTKERIANDRGRRPGGQREGAVQNQNEVGSEEVSALKKFAFLRRNRRVRSFLKEGCSGGSSE